MPKAWIQNGAWGLLILAVTVGGHLMFAERQQVYGHNPRVATSTSEVATAPGAATSTLAATSTVGTSTQDTGKKKREEPPDCSLPGFSGYPECQGYVSPTPQPTPRPNADSVPSASLQHAHGHADANTDAN